MKNISVARVKTNKACNKIAEVIADIRDKGYSLIAPFSIGRVEKRMKVFAENHGIELGSVCVYINSRAISHAQRETKKGKGLAVPESALVSFPVARRKMDVYFDGAVFVYTDYKNKFVVHPNYDIKISRKRKRKVTFVTAGVVTDVNEFILPKYKKI